jgi:chaperonin GroES
MNFMPAEMETPEDPNSQATDNTVARLLASTNLADTMSEDKLEEIGATCKAGFERDLRSREDWERELDEWTDLAMQIRTEKTFPWPKASNVKYPLLSTASMQFAARAYPSLIPSNGKVVQGTVIGKDPTGQKRAKADRVATYMSYQLMHDMHKWEEDMDKLLMMLPIVGTVFKKTFYDANKEKIKSCLIGPKDLVVDYWAHSLEEAERVSEIMAMTPRQLKERQRKGLFRDVDLGQQPQPQTDNNERTNPFDGAVDETTPYTLIEQHRFLDLDDDGYEEPYVVTFHKESGTVLRIVARFDEDGIEERDGKVARITPHHYYTKFSFVPNPDGSFYSLGFGVLLGPINEAVNSLINQLVDAGTLSNMQGGFIGKGLRLKMGEQRFSPGEWKTVNSTGDDLRKNIVALPAKDPSNVLFQLMGSLITSGKELASVAEIFTGKMPGQNTPATTTMATVEQGMKVFTAVYKRIFRSLDEEFKKIYHLNGIYLDPQTEVAVLDEPIGPDDFKDESYDICPAADPSAVSQQEKLMKAQGLIEIMGMAPGMLNPIEVVSRVLEAQEQPNWQQLFTQEVQQSGQLPPPPPDPKMIAMQQKMQADQQMAGLRMEEKQQDMELKQRDAVLQLQMKAAEHAQDMEVEQRKAVMGAASEIQKQRIFQAQAAAQGAQKLSQSEQQHQQKLTQAKELKSSQASANKNSGTGKASSKPKNSSKP